MRAAIVLALWLAIGTSAGCNRGSGFEDEAEEIEYLSSLSNPTPEQWRRKKELVQKADIAEMERQDAIRNDPATIAAEKDAAAKSGADAIRGAAEKAREYERDGLPMGAIGCWEALQRDYPLSDEAKAAPQEIVRLTEVCRRMGLLPSAE